MESGPQLTQLLRAWSNGDQGALEQLVPLVYEELHRLARRYMADERPGNTLQATALVNEAYLRLVHSEPGGFNDRAHFFAVAARVMRRILVDRALAPGTKTRHDVPVLELQDDLAVAVAGSGNDLVAIDDALKTLEPLLREALGATEKTSPDAWSRYYLQGLLGASLAGQKKCSDAETLLVAGYEGMVQRAATIPVAGRHSALEEAGRRIVQLYEGCGQAEKAAEWRQKLQSK